MRVGHVNNGIGNGIDDSDEVVGIEGRHCNNCLYGKLRQIKKVHMTLIYPESEYTCIYFYSPVYGNCAAAMCIWMHFHYSWSYG